MADISIIINGRRYDAVPNDSGIDDCELCEMRQKDCCAISKCPLAVGLYFEKSKKNEQG